MRPRTPEPPGSPPPPRNLLPQQRAPVSQTALDSTAAFLPPAPPGANPSCSYPRTRVHSLPRLPAAGTGPSCFPVGSCVCPARTSWWPARSPNRPPPLLLLGSGKTSPAPLAAAAMTPAFLFCAPSPLSWTRNVPPARFPLRPCLPAIRNGPSLRFLQVLERALISVSFPGPGRTPSCLCPERVPIPLPEPGPIRA